MWIRPGTEKAERANRYLDNAINREYSLQDLLKRPTVTYNHIKEIDGADAPELDRQVVEQVEIGIKYQGYIDRQADEIERLKRSENIALPEDIDYQNIKGLSIEVSQKLGSIRPETIGQAGRVSGVTPAAVSLLLVYLKKRNLLKQQRA